MLTRTGHEVKRDDVLRTAAELVPVLKDRAARTERLRRIPPETVSDLRASGLIRIGNPRRYGGNGLDIDAAYEVAWELGRGCGSTAWCYALWTVHNWWIGHFSEQAQDELFATGPDTVFSSGLNPLAGEAERVSGGFRISGRWSFSSGCDVATWAMVATQGAGSLLWSLIPRGDFEIVDTWFASGMRGTGSHDVVVKNAFVPAHRAIDANRAGDGEWSGWEQHRRPSYRLPLRAMTGWDLAAPLIGIAQGAVDEFAGRAQKGVSARGQGPSALALRLADASAHVDAARALHRQDIRELLACAARGETPGEPDRARYRRDKGFIARLCVQAVNTLFEGSGARAIMESEPLQRFHRDAHAASHHAALSWDTWAEQFGRQALGLDD
jgi:3-hydroxy-9,10-secoandrosta-1,3,5(10)-triene-9,17-dione monooxygenase